MSNTNHNILNILNNILTNDASEYGMANFQSLHDCVIEYYPHIKRCQSNCGYIYNNTHTIDALFDNISGYVITKYKCVDYTHRQKKMIIYESGNKEILSIQQKWNIMTDNGGLLIASKIECIDPNRFPILCNYDEISRKLVKLYSGKYMNIFIITEGNATYPKITFTIPHDEQHKRGLIRHFNEVISLL